MKFKHTCLDGEERKGQETDCEQCRLLLLDSFRGPDRPVDRRAGPRHVQSLPDSIRLEPRPFPPPGPSEHIIRCGIDPGPGVWSAACSCGWGTSGVYPHGEESSGRAVAEGVALAHAMDPEGIR